MPPKKKTSSRSPAPQTKLLGLNANVVILELRRMAKKKTRDGMARYGLPSDRAFGVAVSGMHKLAKRIGKNHELAGQLWKTGWYEARMMAAFLGEADRVTSKEMDHWCRDFDNWGICDTVCFYLWDRTRFAWQKIKPWSNDHEEFVKRAGFVLMACLAGHDKTATDKQFLSLLPLIEKGAVDERNFVKKGVSWALRMIGRRSNVLNIASVERARRLVETKSASARWIGKAAIKELTSPAVTKRFSAKHSD